MKGKNLRQASNESGRRLVAIPRRSRSPLLCSIVLLLLIGSPRIGCMALDATGIAVPSELLSLQKHLAKVPDFQMEYRTVFEGPVGPLVEKYRYLKKGGSWRYEIFNAEGDLQSVLSFDGEKYYNYAPTSNYLFISPDPSPITREVYNVFLHNPVYTWGGMFFHGAEALYKTPELSEPATWVEQLGKFTITPQNEKAPKQTRWKMQSADRQFDVLVETTDTGGVQLTEFTAWGGGPPAMRKVATKMSFNDWQIIPVGDSSVFLPMRIAADSKFPDGKPVTQGDVAIEVIPGSIKSLPPNLGPTAFRVPLTSVSNPIIWPANRSNVPPSKAKPAR